MTLTRHERLQAVAVKLKLHMGRRPDDAYAAVVLEDCEIWLQNPQNLPVHTIPEFVVHDAERAWRLILERQA